MEFPNRTRPAVQGVPIKKKTACITAQFSVVSKHKLDLTNIGHDNID